MEDIYFLAVETSCDDTSVAVLRVKEEKRKLKKIEALSNVVSSQTQLHAGYGGVYPFLAKREHQKNLPLVFEQAIKKIDLSKIQFIGVTKGPGLDPCLWTGINFSQNLAKKCGFPLVGSNHLEAHFLANLLTLGIGEIEFSKKYLPAVCLVVSGGHTLLFLAHAIGNYELLGETQDDAAGECFDKAARILGLGYPGGSEIAKYAEQWNSPSLRSVSWQKIGEGNFLPRPMMNQKNYNFSFSGLKTAVLYSHQKQTPETQNSKEYQRAMSYEVQQAIVEVLVSKTKRAAETLGAKSIIIGGGVSANKVLREEMKKSAKGLEIKFLAPSPDLSVDNAAMAGVAAYFAWKWGEIVANPDDLLSEPNLGI
ncbi:MAG: tRNA (adenosine(37)-N6)-threonylcarbamoyltransferase complex transferase subunit TsaD [Candidatus Paceibacterota bacterium]